MKPMGAGVLLVAAGALLGCDAPAEAAVSRCRRLPFGPVSCELEIEDVVKNQVFHIATETKNFEAKIIGSFEIEQGKASIVAMGCKERPRIDVEHRGPGRSAPVPFECVAQVNRNDFTVTIDSFAIGGKGRGLRGRIEITPQ